MCLQTEKTIENIRKYTFFKKRTNLTVNNYKITNSGNANFQDTPETRNQLFIICFSICMTEDSLILLGKQDYLWLKTKKDYRFSGFLIYRTSLNFPLNLDS